jgi:hypothetical protein
LSALDDSVLHLGDGLKSNYILVQHALRGSQTELAALFNNQPNPTAELLRLRLPWEKAREERLSKVSTNLSLQQVESLRETLADEKSCLYAVSSSSDYSRRDHYLSPPLFLSNYYWGMQAADELAEFEQRRRATLILLALVGYRLEHDKLPATLSELVDVYLPELPLDPYSGRDFLYFPDGLPRAATEIDAADLAEAQKRSRDMILGQPGIWSTGPNLVTQTLRSDGLQLTDELVPVPAPDVTYYVERGDYQYHRLPLYRALGTGRLFRLPILEAELRQWHSK